MVPQQLTGPSKVYAKFDVGFLVTSGNLNSCLNAIKHTPIQQQSAMESDCLHLFFLYKSKQVVFVKPHAPATDIQGEGYKLLMSSASS